MNNPLVKKSVCERYDLRWEHNGWATFTIDEKDGMFNCQSDFGSYNYSWPYHGCKSFKHFIVNELARCSSYFLGKVSACTYFDFDKNLEQWKATIIEYRKDGTCTREQARSVWDFFKEMDRSSSADHVQHALYECKAISDIFEEPWYVFDTDKDYPPSAVHFAKVVMPMFAEILKEEID